MDKVMSQPDSVVASTATAVGVLGITYQMLFDALSITALGINVLLAAGGLYLLYLKIKRARRDLKRGDR